jgi:hypothetical protein
VPPPLPVIERERTLIVRDDELEVVPPPDTTPAHTAPAEPTASREEILVTPPARPVVVFVRAASFFAVYLAQAALRGTRALAARARDVIRSEWGRASARARAPRDT